LYRIEHKSKKFIGQPFRPGENFEDGRQGKIQYQQKQKNTDGLKDYLQNGNRPCFVKNFIIPYFEAFYTFSFLIIKPGRQPSEQLVYILYKHNGYYQYEQ